MDNKDTRYTGLRKHSRESNEFVRECLKSALLKLADGRGFKSLSITELCNKAGVSRMAFYRNYSVINDVFNEIAYDLNNAVIEKIGSPFRVNTDRNWYLQAFKTIASNKEAMSIMFQESFQAEWMKRVNGFAVHDDNFSAEKKYQRLMWSGGFENVVAQWLNGGLKETPEEMADYCIKYLPHMLKDNE